MKRRPKRQGLFVGYWFDQAGKRIGRVKRSEIAEAYRLWALHKDIRCGLSEREPAVTPIHRESALKYVDSSRSLNSRPTFSDEVA